MAEGVGAVVNETDRGAEFHVVGPVDPGQVLGNVVDGNDSGGPRADAIRRGKPAQIRVTVAQNAGGLTTLTRQAIAQSADQARPQQRRPTGGDALVVGQQHGVGLLSWELRRIGTALSTMVVLEVAAQKQHVLAGAVELVIETRD